MVDNIFYCNDLAQLEQELRDNGMFDEETQTYTHGNTLTPIVKNGVKSLALVRDNKLDLTLFPSLTNLGTYTEMFGNPTNHALYKSVYPYDEPVFYTDENGVQQSYMRPEKIGIFA